MITAVPSLSKSCESLKRSVLSFSFARPFSMTNSAERSPACRLWMSEVGFEVPPAEKNGTTLSVAGSTASRSHLPVVCRWKPWNCPVGLTPCTLAWTLTLPLLWHPNESPPRFHFALPWQGPGPPGRLRPLRKRPCPPCPRASPSVCRPPCYERTQMIGEALERVMNSIRNGLGMQETEIAREPS